MKARPEKQHQGETLHQTPFFPEGQTKEPSQQGHG
jgi:hypothetical protein